MEMWASDFLDYWVSIWYDEDICAYIMEWSTTFRGRRQFNKDVFLDIITRYNMKKVR